MSRFSWSPTFRLWDQSMKAQESDEPMQCICQRDLERMEDTLDTISVQKPWRRYKMIDGYNSNLYSYTPSTEYNKYETFDKGILQRNSVTEK